MLRFLGAGHSAALTVGSELFPQEMNERLNERAEGHPGPGPLTDSVSRAGRDQDTAVPLC